MLAVVTISAIVGLASAVIVAKKERENELYADLKAFRNCEQDDKYASLNYFFEKSHCPRWIRNREDEVIQDGWFKITTNTFTLKNIFSGYPSTLVQYRQLHAEWHRHLATVSPQNQDLIHESQHDWLV